MARRPLRLTFHPLTRDRWDAFETLFGKRGACGGCWCMLWRRSRSEFEADKGDGNRRAMRSLVDAGAEPGLLGFAGEEPVGWCAVAPRDDYPGLGRSRVLKAVDDVPVWSVSCLFVRKDYRKRGVSIALLKAAVEFVAARGGTVVEGYPVEPNSEEMPAAFAWTGIASSFLRAGFYEHHRGSEKRPIMRFEINKRPGKTRH